MPASYIYKAEGERGKRGIFLTPQEDQRSTPFAILPDGRKIQGQYVNTNEGRHQYLFGNDILGQQGVKIEYGGKTIDLEDSNKSYEGNNPYDGWTYRNKGDLGSGGGGGGGNFAPGFGPGNIGYGSIPAFLGGQFPTPFLTTFNPIQAAPFKFTDPKKFAQEYGDANRAEMQKNFGLAKEFSLDLLDQELQGLRGYVPGAAALKRQETAIDNVYNSIQRENAVNRAIPDARRQLDDQAARAESYARGEIPDSITDRMAELKVRSDAADRASAGGFGVGSRAAEKLSDSMSVEQRVRFSQYGDQLISSNINQKAQLFLPPTSYSDAGQQVRVTPEVGAARLTSQNFSELNRGSILDPGAAFSGEVSQNQFQTQLEQGTRTFNAQGQFSESQLNAGIQNQFAMDKFQYLNGYANSVAGASQLNTNTGLELAQQQQAQQIYQDYLSQAQDANTIGSVVQGIGSIPGIISGVAGAISSVSDAFGLSANPESNAGVGVDTGGGVSNAGSGASDVAPLGSVGQDGVSYPSADTVPVGYTPISSNPDGTVTAIPDASFRSAATSYARSTGYPAPSTSVMPRMAAQSSAVLRNAGISREALPGFQPIGTDDSGRTLYGNTTLMKSDDVGAGQRLANSAYGVLKPLGLFDTKDGDTFGNIARVSGDAAFITQLTDLAARKDSKGFIAAVANRFQQPIAAQISDNPDNQAGVGAGFTAFNLFQNWDRMSGAQKSLGLATLGIQGYKFATGENLAQKTIPGTDIAGTPEMNVGQALTLFNAGYNVYSMVNNWGQLNNIQKVAGGTATVASLANVAKQFNLLGSGTTGSAVSVTAPQLAASGLTPAPAYGIGAVVGPTGAQIPAGYTTIANTQNGVVAIPTATSESAASTSMTAGSLLGTAAGIAGITLGANQVYKNWGTGGKSGAANGALGGTAIAAGLYSMSGGPLGVAAMSNPYVLGGVVAVSLLGGMAKTGKHKDQSARDGVRSALQKNGLVDKDFKVTLADGKAIDVGIDGHGAERKWSKADMRTGKQRNVDSLRSYDIDYTNDLDYSAGMMGSAISRLIGGGKSKAVDQMGGQLGNAGLGNIGFGKEMSKDNFSKLTANMRSMFAKAGIKSKADAYALVNQGFGESRWNESDVVTMQQAINMAFDPNGYDTAQKLMQGRWKGVEVVQSEPTGERAPTVPTPNFRPAQTTPGLNPKNMQNTMDIRFNSNGNRSWMRSKDEARTANARRYARV